MQLTTTGERETALLDSGATENFMNLGYSIPVGWDYPYTSSPDPGPSTTSTAH